jgi:hypothetical protein
MFHNFDTTKDDDASNDASNDANPSSSTTTDEETVPHGDYIVNMGFNLRQLLPSSLLHYHLIVRDIISLTVAGVLLFVQKVYPRVVQEQSSPESYNTTISEALYEWSRRTIRQYD